MRLTGATWTRDTNRDRRCAPPRSGSGPLRRVLSCMLWCMLWCTASCAMSRAVGIGPGLATGWGGRDGCWALTLGAVAQGAEPAPATAEDRDARERRVLAFVAEHQPDLADVLAHLAKKPDEHAEAIADLDRSVRALSATRRARLAARRAARAVPRAGALRRREKTNFFPAPPYARAAPCLRPPRRRAARPATRARGAP